MKKLSIISLIISIFALLIAVWVWTDGFGSAGTFAGRVTSLPSGGGTGGKGGSGQQDFSGSQVVSGTTTTSSQVVLSEFGTSDTMVIKNKTGAELFRATVIPVGYTSGNSTIMVGLRVTKIEAATGAQQLLSDIKSFRTNLGVVQTYSTYQGKIETSATQSVDVVALNTELRRVLQKISAEAGQNSSLRIVYTDITIGPGLRSLPIIVDANATITGTTDTESTTDLWRIFPHVLSDN